MHLSSISRSVSSTGALPLGSQYATCRTHHRRWMHSSNDMEEKGVGALWGRGVPTDARLHAHLNVNYDGVARVIGASVWVQAAVQG